MLKRILEALGLRTAKHMADAVQAATSSAYQQGHQAGFVSGHLVGSAQGELKGRRDLAQELEIAHGVGGGDIDMTLIEIATLRIRQLH